MNDQLREQIGRILAVLERAEPRCTEIPTASSPGSELTLPARINETYAIAYAISMLKNARTCLEELGQ